MIKVYIPNTSTQKIGGGWSFINNLTIGGKGKIEMVNNWKDCDIILITGATMTDRKEMDEAKRNGKKIVFRIDNMPKDSRNRGTAFSRMKDFGIMADYIIFQSEWASGYIGDWLRRKGSPAMVANINVHEETPTADMWENNCVIYNGVDTSIFNYDDDPS